MALSLDANLACSRIHAAIQSSGLHYIINQTPWSSYITIRRKFVNTGISSIVAADEESDKLKQLRRENEQLKNKLAIAETDAASAEESLKNAHLSLGANIENLNSNIKVLENALQDSESKLKVKDTEIFDHVEELKNKDIIIQNMNTGFNNKIADLKAELVELKAFKKDTIKKEKKAQKKQKEG